MIRKIKWNDHAILGNLELDFTKPDGSVYNTIVLAGENGTGKTTILETLSTFLNLGSIEPFEYISYMADGVPYTITPNPDDFPEFGFHSRRNEVDGTTQVIRSNRNNPKLIESDLADLRHYGFSYSKARSGFNTQKVKSTTIQQLDSEKYENDTKDDFTSIKQLIVDIDAQDNSEWMKITESGAGTSFTTFKQTSKKYRFEKAFNEFFDTIKFRGVNNTNPDEIKIIFEKHGKEIPVDSLSTGEKQIVFRGTHLLKNINSMSGGIALVDEPELSMHPKWQQKVLQFYRNLFNKYDLEKDDTSHLYIVGSVGRKTAIKGISDLDILFDLPSDTYKKFDAYQSNGQSALLQEVKESLQERYPKTDISGDGQVVVIEFNHYSAFPC